MGELRTVHRRSTRRTDGRKDGRERKGSSGDYDYVCKQTQGTVLQFFSSFQAGFCEKPLAAINVLVFQKTCTIADSHAEQ